MLHRSCRLDKKQLDEVLKNGKIVHTQFFWLKFLKKEESSRFASIVPQKIVKKAVDRNRFRRKIYSIFESFKNNINQGYLFVLCMKEPLTKLNKQQIEDKTREIFVKARFLK